MTVNKQNGNRPEKTTLLLPSEVGFDTNAWSYKDHISFFMEPVPLDMVAGAFENHNFWYGGNKICEYVVKLTALGEFNYYLTESHEKTDLIEKYFYTEKLLNDSDDDDPKVIADFRNKKIKIHKENKYIGNGLTELKLAMNNSNADIRKDYLAFPKRPSYADNTRKYAATIPHLMVYPFSGEVELFSSRLVTVANARKYCK